MSGGVEISLRDIYEAQQQTNANVAGLATTVAQFTAGVTARLDSGQRHISDLEERTRVLEQAPKVGPAQVAALEERVRMLERVWWKLAGALLVVNVLVIAAAALLGHYGLGKG